MLNLLRFRDWADFPEDETPTPVLLHARQIHAHQPPTFPHRKSQPSMCHTPLAFSVVEPSTTLVEDHLGLQIRDSGPEI